MSFFKPPDKFAEIIKITRVLKFKEFTPKIIYMPEKYIL